MIPALILALAILAPGAGLMLVELRHAPVGWEDADGFCFGSTQEGTLK